MLTRVQKIKMAADITRRLIDIGANLTDGMFRGTYHSSQRHRDDFSDMLARAKEHGVEKMIITGGTLSESGEALKLAKNYVHLFSTVGCHPTRCNEFDNHPEGSEAYLKKLSNLAQNGRPKVVAIGEIGLDYDRLHFCTKEVQKKYFEQQLNLADETKLPLFLHNRNSIDDFVEILTRNKSKFQQGGGVVHSFDGTTDDLTRCLNLGLYIGINGCSLKTEENLMVAKQIPADSLMIETDCPYCEIRTTHAGFKFVKTKFQRSKDAKDPSLPVKGRNEPMTLIQVLEVLAEIRNEDINKLSRQVYENTNRLFNLS